MVLDPGDVPDEVFERLAQYREDASVFFKYRLDIAAEPGALDVVMAVNDQVVEIVDAEQEIEHRMAEIEAKRIVLLVAMRVDEDEMETEIFAVPVPMNDRARAMLRVQVEGDVANEMLWMSLGEAGQSDAVDAVLAASLDPEGNPKPHTPPHLRLI